MKINIIAVGKLKTGPLHALYATYHQRLKWPVFLEEIEGYGTREPQTQKIRETQTLLSKIPERAVPVFLDPRGTPFSSSAFAHFLERLATTNQYPSFVIGGAEGLESSLFPQKHYSFSFGPAIWPHLLARIMLMEQLYRAQEILAGGKYHRE